MDDSGKQTQRDSVEVIYDLAMKRLDAQIAEIEAIDNKLRLLFWFASIIITALLGFLSVEHFNVNCVCKGFFGATVLAFATVFVATVLGYRFTRPQYLPKVDDLRRHALEKPAETTTRAILIVVARQINNNRTLVRKKELYGKLALWILFPEVGLAVVTLFLAVFL